MGIILILIYRMANVIYTDEQIDTFIETAKEIGIGRAQRELGYPNSWATANRWVKARGVTITVDSLKQKAAEMHDWYDTEEALLVTQAGMDRVHEALVEQELDADSIKKLGEAFTKFANVWMTLKGKATNINETRSVGELDAEIQKIIDEENARNKLIEESTDNVVE
jgi:hypothetical protein